MPKHTVLLRGEQDLIIEDKQDFLSRLVELDDFFSKKGVKPDSEDYHFKRYDENFSVEGYSLYSVDLGGRASNSSIYLSFCEEGGSSKLKYEIWCPYDRSIECTENKPCFCSELEDKIKETF